MMLCCDTTLALVLLSPPVVSFGGQFMVGSEYIVAPALAAGQTSVSTYLPAGVWVHLWSGQTYGNATAGTFVSVAAPVGQPGVFHRNSSEALRFSTDLRRRLGDNVFRWSGE